MSEGGSFLPRLAPLLLRVVIGGTFLWAGLGKLIPEVDFRGQDAAIAANLGAPIKIPAKPTSPGPLTLPPPSQIPLGDRQPATEAPPVPQSPASQPNATTSPGKPESAVPPPPPASDGQPSRRPSSTSARPARPAAELEEAAPSTRPIHGAMFDDLPPAANVTRKQAAGQPAGQQAPVAPPPTTQPPAPLPPAPLPPAPLPPGGKYTAADFPDPVKLPRVYQLAVVLTKAAYPAAGSSVWPKQLSGNPWAVYAAYLVAVVEILAGSAVLLGFFVKPAALILAGVILSAIWITQIGPAAMGVAPNILGFLPKRTWYDPQLWTPMLWQLLIFVSCLVLAMIGPGLLSADAALSAIGASEKSGDKGDK